PAAPAPPAAATGGPPPPGSPGEEEYYRDLSHDMYREVGRLARRLSMSIRDVKVERVEDFDLENAGQRLEQAKDQLENVVKMTEQATMKIIDLGEEIQKAIDRARNIMERMSVQTPVSGGSEGEALEQANQELADALGALTGYLGELDQEPLAPALSQAEALLDLMQAGAGQGEPAAVPAPVAAPAAPAGPRYKFPLDLVFQTTYELCTNETVKKHIKAMWEAGDKGFNQPQVEAALNELVEEGPDADNFLNLDLQGVLKALFKATGQERFQQVLKKMASTADQIFLEQSLPLEALPDDSAPAEPPAPAAAAAGPAMISGDILDGAQALVDELRADAARLTPPPLPRDLAELWEKVQQAQAAHASVNVVEPHLVEELHTTMAVIFSSVNSIIEALSFQDLSGQTIYRIVRLLTDFQVQLLAMVVSFGSKIKAKETQARVTAEESERMAQEEVDKVLDTLGVHEDASEAQGVETASKLDQGAINDLLANMGF
ncbi:MAG: protein phosphatase CheZ, partial [Pseudomonadota bacterium]